MMDMGANIIRVSLFERDRERERESERGLPETWVTRCGEKRESGLHLKSPTACADIQRPEGSGSDIGVTLLSSCVVHYLCFIFFLFLLFFSTEGPTHNAKRAVLCCVY